MIFNIFDLNGVEGADADLQGKVMEAGALMLQFSDQIGRKVEACGRGRPTAIRLSKSA
jgi:hypothetical protein